jgi:hypothetical protein
MAMQKTILLALRVASLADYAVLMLTTRSSKKAGQLPG